MQEKIKTLLSYLNKRKPAVLAGTIIILLLILSLFIIKSRQSKPVPQPPQQGKAPSTPQSSSETKSPPQVSFQSYDNRAPLPTVPNTVNGYTLKTNYTVDETKEFGKKLGMTEVKVPDDRFVILYNMTDMNSRGILTFDRVTGGISFQSYGVHKTESPNSEGLQDTARRFLTSLNLLDPTISCPITYQRKVLTGVTFVECHRDWSLVGLPILNSIGVLNIPENTSLSSLAVGKTEQSSPDDPSVINVSTGNGTGKARPTDFNSITVGVTDNGRILTLESNMRKIVETKQYAPSDLLSPEETLNQFIQHKAQFSLTIPAGSGSVDWSKVYPDNQANGKKAIITDYLLTYLENPGQAPQERMVPMYIIRGTAELSSGYTVRFMETVPALKSGLSFLPKQGQVAGDQTNLLAQSDSSLKLGTFQPEVTTAQKSPRPTTPSSSSPQPIPTESSSSYTLPCQLRTIVKEVIWEIPGLGRLTTGYLSPHRYYFKSAMFPVASMQEVRDIFFGPNGPVVTQYTINVSRWLDENSTKLSSQPSAVQDMLALYLQINGTTKTGQDGWGFFNAKQEAPPVITDDDLKTNQRFGDALNMRRTRQVGTFVAQKILDALHNNQIKSLASQVDVFPPETTNSFAQILLNGVNEGEGADTLCFISGNSPSLYLYPEKEMGVKVGVGGPVSYSYPSLVGNTWDVVAKPDGTLEESGIMNYKSWKRLYYEYDKSKVQFSEPNEGFIVKTDEWEGFIRDTLSPQLGLTQAEEDDLVVDIRNALSDVSKVRPYVKDGPLPKYLKISFASQEELDEKLPLTISPQPTSFHRIHLLITPLDKEVQIVQPKVDKLIRSGFTAVELGASVYP